MRPSIADYRGLAMLLLVASVGLAWAEHIPHEPAIAKPKSSPVARSAECVDRAPPPAASADANRAATIDA